MAADLSVAADPIAVADRILVGDRYGEAAHTAAQNAAVAQIAAVDRSAEAAHTAAQNAVVADQIAAVDRYAEAARTAAQNVVAADQTALVDLKAQLDPVSLVLRAPVPKAKSADSRCAVRNSPAVATVQFAAGHAKASRRHPLAKVEILAPA